MMCDAPKAFSHLHYYIASDFSLCNGGGRCIVTSCHGVEARYMVCQNSNNSSKYADKKSIGEGMHARNDERTELLEHRI